MPHPRTFSVSPAPQGQGRYKAAAYFDVDGTLTATNLLQPTFYYLANQAHLWSSAAVVGRALLQGPLMALAELRDRRLFNEMLFAHYQGMSEDRMKVLSEEVFEQVIRPRLFKGARALLEKYHQAGMEVVLVTGSLDCTIKYLAEHIGADDVIANKLEYKEGYATGKLLRPVVAGPEKSGLIVAHARARGYDLMSCHALSDSYSDVPMLSVVGHPACIRPDSRLRRLAETYDWPILDIDVEERGTPAAAAR
jgi:HAD superfamily hydrolase (TIGR01490 family)